MKTITFVLFNIILYKKFYTFFILSIASKKKKNIHTYNIIYIAIVLLRHTPLHQIQLQVTCYDALENNK